MYEYKGLTIYRSDKGILSKDCNYVDSEGNTMNKIKPLFYGYAKWTKHPNKSTGHLHVSMFGGDNRDSENDSDVEYTKQRIDEYLKNREKRIIEKWKSHRSGKVRKYILNNVTIVAIWTTESKSIHVNDKHLRNVSLNKDFTFEDVLKQVYLNVIAKYNTYDPTIPKYITDIKEIKIDLSILPLYEYIGYQVELNSEVFIIKDVWDYYYDDKADFKLITDKGDKLILLNDIPNIKLLGEVEGDISILINKSNFYE